MKQTELMKEFYYVDLLEAIADCWNQFAIEGTNGKFAGGLSTLESVESILKEHSLLLPDGKVDWDKIENLRDEVNR